MRGKNKNIRFFIFGILIIFFSGIVYGKENKVPNELIYKNPYKKIETVKAKKNREHGEMNINVNKINTKEIVGIKLPTGEVVVYLPNKNKNENKILKEEVYYVADSMDKFPSISTVNGKRLLQGMRKTKDSVIGENIQFKNYNNILILNGINSKKIYIGKIDKHNGDISKIWEVIIGGIKNGSELIGVKLDKEKKVLITIPEDKKGKKILDNIKDISFYPINSNLNEEYKIEKKVNVVHEAKDYKENQIIINYENNIGDGYLFITSGDNITVHKLKIAEIKNTKIASGAWSYYLNFNKPETLEYGGQKYLWVGNYLRINRQFSANDITVDGEGYYNFSIPRVNISKMIPFDIVLKNGTKIEKELELELNNKFLIEDTAGEYLSNPGSAHDSYLRTGVYNNKEELKKVVQGEMKKYLPLDRDYKSFALGFKILFKLDNETYKNIAGGEYIGIANKEALSLKIRKWHVEMNYIDIIEEIFPAQVVNATLNNEQENIAFKLTDRIGKKKLGKAEIVDNGESLVVNIVENGVLLLNATLEQLKKGFEIPNSGVLIRYIDRHQLTFEKLANKKYISNNLKLSLKDSTGNLVKQVLINLTNESGFSILPDKGTLNFGSFFPGDSKKMENLIEFNNVENVNISVDVSPKEYYIYKVSNEEITPQRKIKIENLKIRDLSLEQANISSFKLSGVAKAAVDTEPGDYKGTIDVIITVEPN